MPSYLMAYSLNRFSLGVPVGRQWTDFQMEPPFDRRNHILSTWDFTTRFTGGSLRSRWRSFSSLQPQGSGGVTTLPAKCHGGAEIRKHPDPDMRCSPDMGGKEFGEKDRRPPGNDSNVAIENGAERLQCGGNINDFRLILGLIDGVTQVNERGGFGKTTGIGMDAFDRSYKVMRRQHASSDNPDLVA